MGEKNSQPKIALSPAHIYVWLAYYESIVDPQLLATYRELLSDAERTQAGRFYFERDRHRYLVTRALTRTVLGRLLDLKPSDLRFETNEHGRPHLSNDECTQSGLAFNISHTRGLIALAVAKDRGLGVDVENISERENSLAIAERFFAPEEATALANTASDAQRERFFEYWTLKESYIKARGMGLAIPLDKFSFCLAGDAIDFHVDDSLNDNANRWRFFQFRPTPKFVLALCVGTQAVLHEPLFLHTVPLVVEEIAPLCALRRSR